MILLVSIIYKILTITRSHISCLSFAPITMTLVQIAYGFGLEVNARLIGIQIQFSGGTDDC